MRYLTQYNIVTKLKVVAQHRSAWIAVRILANPILIQSQAC